jgi:DNA-binding NarL/FixJ family response regulator
MIRVVLVDDHGVVRAGLMQLFENYDDIEVVGTAADGREAVDVCRQHQPDVVLMDLSMPVLDGIESTRQVMKAVPGTRIVVLTSFSDRDRIIEALDAGAVGYLLKDAEPEELPRGVRAAAMGESPLAPKAASAVLAARHTRGSVEELTDREREVLILLTSGLANKQIARRLGVSEKTIKAHLTNVFRRIGVEDRTQAALWAERKGLLKESLTAS